MKTIDVIVPVYDAYDQTVRCLNSLLASENKTSSEIIVVYDAGPDETLKRYITGLAVAGRLTLLENERNLGFVVSVSRGMALHPDRDVILLNSDTEVANDWLDRMVTCADSDETIATVTPFSNNAEICSFPVMCQANALPAGWSVEALDAAFAAGVSPAAVDLPTGVGFCLFIRRRALDEVGGFNEQLFGRGYGEENDFCRRVAIQGWRNVLCTNVFVYHEGGASFGEQKQARVANAMRVLDKLYPDYHGLVHAFIKADPPRLYRQQAALAALDPHNPRILMITHNLGGGTLRHVRELAGHIAGQAHVFVLRLTAPGHFSMTAELALGNVELTYQWPEQRALFYQSCRQLGIDRVHIHHVKGFEGVVLGLLKRLVLPYDVTLHDYYLINGNPTLADKSGLFCADKSQRDAVCGKQSPVPLGLSAEQWRVGAARFLAGAERVFAPSRYAAELHADYFPGLDITVRPHPDWEREAPYPSVKWQHLRPERKLVVGVLGALGLEKGADILEKTALLAKKNKCRIEFHLIGYAYRKLRGVVEHGAYRDAELSAILRRVNPHCIWFPCQWPETYSYTLSACLREGLPVLAPAFGAFVERLQDRPASWLQPAPTSPERWLESLLDIEQRLRLTASTELHWSQASLPTEAHGYKANYVVAKRGGPLTTTKEELLDLLVRTEIPVALPESIAKKERLLRLLIKTRSVPGFLWLTRSVPFSWQRRLKRLLSEKALHEMGDEVRPDIRKITNV